MTNKEFAEFLLPGVKHTWQEYEEMYPERDLKEGAIVTRYAPSPTGLPHMGNLFQLKKRWADSKRITDRPKERKLKADLF